MKRNRSSSQAEMIRLAIEGDIFSGKLKPGAQIDDAALAQRFSVSRTPVREAILKLEHSGLIERLPRKGSVVMRTDIKRLIMSFELMSELEGVCARLSVRRMSEADRQALISTHKASEDALLKGNFETYYAHSHKFHLHLIFGTQNKELIDVANRIGIGLVPYRRFQLRYPGRSEINLRDHQEILDAVLARDADRAATLMKQHTTVQGDAMAEYVLMSETEGSAAKPDTVWAGAGFVDTTLS